MLYQNMKKKIMKNAEMQIFIFDDVITLVLYGLNGTLSSPAFYTAFDSFVFKTMSNLFHLAFVRIKILFTSCHCFALSRMTFERSKKKFFFFIL